ncbi:MAG: hypothetical protein P8Y44_09905 [Acidobacteriota bacterium]
MGVGDDSATTTPTLPFDRFWEWLVRHSNCILRAGSREAVLYDDEDYHWHFASEDHGTWLVQVIRGKRLVGELLIAEDRVAYVQGQVGDQAGEYVFDLVASDELDPGSAFFFVLSHGYESETEVESGRVH